MAMAAVLPSAVLSAELEVCAARAAASCNSVMIQAVIDFKKCACRDVCLARDACLPRAIIQMDPGGEAMVNGSLCNGCGDCVSECPEKAISMKDF